MESKEPAVDPKPYCDLGFAFDPETTYIASSIRPSLLPRSPGLPQRLHPQGHRQLGGLHHPQLEGRRVRVPPRLRASTLQVPRGQVHLLQRGGL